MEIVVKVVPEVAGALREHTSNGRALAIQGVAKAFGAKLTPLHRRVHTGNLATYFVIEYGDAAQVSRLTESLRSLPDVTAAYVKPAAEPAVD